MTRTPDQTISDLMRIGAPQVLVALAQGVPAPGTLKWEIQEPLTFRELIAEHPNNMPFETDLIPLWETNGDCVVAYVDRPNPIVIEYYFEDSAEQFKTVGTSVLDAIEYRLEKSYADDGDDVDILIEHARLFEHPGADAFVDRILAKYG